MRHGVQTWCGNTFASYYLFYNHNVCIGRSENKKYKTKYNYFLTSPQPPECLEGRPPFLQGDRGDRSVCNSWLSQPKSFL